MLKEKKFLFHLCIIICLSHSLIILFKSEVSTFLSCLEDPEKHNLTQKEILY